MTVAMLLANTVESCKKYAARSAPQKVTRVIINNIILSVDKTILDLFLNKTFSVIL